MSSAPSPNALVRTPFTAGNFRVEIDSVAATSFSEVSGLELSIDVVDYRAGDSNQNTPQKLPGLSKVSDVTLKRGVTQDTSLWNWIKRVSEGDITRGNVSVILLDQADNPRPGMEIAQRVAAQVRRSGTLRGIERPGHRTTRNLPRGTGPGYSIEAEGPSLESGHAFRQRMLRFRHGVFRNL